MRQLISFIRFRLGKHCDAYQLHVKNCLRPNPAGLNSQNAFHHDSSFRLVPVPRSRNVCGKYHHHCIRTSKKILQGVETVPGFHRRWYQTGDGSDEEWEEEKDIDFDKVSDELLISDIDYNESVRHYCSIPDAGHRIYVLQPFPRKIPKKYRNTTGPLMLEEACALVNTLPRWKVVGKEQLNVTNMLVKRVFGPGQLESITQNIRNTPGVSAVFLSVDMLTQIQLNALQRHWQLPVYDRYTLVLQIFKDHARSKEAKLQIALAEIPMIRSRMEESHLPLRDRSGPTGGVHVPCHVDDKFRYMQTRSGLLQIREKKVREALSALKKQRAVNRKSRLKKKVPTVAVIGYTNAGKTTLIKALTGDERMIPENRLFATLDVTAHPGLLPNNMRAVFMDTVGFISNIPVKLYNAFAATLEDAMLADLIIHVRDISHPDTTGQRENVLTTVTGMLNEQQLNTMIEVCNKMDKVPELVLDEESDCFYISSVTGEGFDDLKAEIQTRLLGNIGYLVKKMRIPLSGPHLKWLQSEATVTGTENDSDYESIIVDVVISEEAYAKFLYKFGPKQRKTAVR